VWASGAMRLSIMRLSIMTSSIMTFRITINELRHTAVLLSWVSFMLSVANKHIMLSVVIPSVIMLSVVVPGFC
jgi:hypothetical protein